MRRLSTLPMIALVTALALSAGSGAIAQALSDAIDDPAATAGTPEADASPADAAPASDSEPAGETPVAKKILHTVPEDGASVAAFEFVPGWLRALLDSRPFEDLIVCIAGCSPHRDRVVYARLKDTPPAPPVAAAQPTPPAAVVAPAAEAAPAAAVAPKAADAVKDEAPAFVPTFNLPLDAPADAPATPAAPPQP